MRICGNCKVELHDECINRCGIRENHPFGPCGCHCSLAFVDPPPNFDGETYEAELDYERLAKQGRAVFDLMSDRKWRTLFEAEAVLGYPPQSISARLRDFRKPKFGAHTVERRYRGDRVNGLFEYRLIPRVKR